jgi:hypothetical protein
MLFIFVITIFSFIYTKYGHEVCVILNNNFEIKICKMRSQYEVTIVRGFRAKRGYLQFFKF